jgi:hypothetical protein
LAFSQRATAIRQRDQAISNQVITEALQYGSSDTPLVAQLTLAAYRIQPTQDTAEVLLNTENTPLPLSLTARAGGFFSFSPDGHTLATSEGYNMLRLWDVTDPAHPARSAGP